MLKKLWLRTVEGRLLLNTEVDANFTDLNDAASWAATGFYGGTDPSALTKVQMEIGLVWADTASGWVKRCQQIEPSVVWKNVARLWDAALPQVTVLPSVDLGSDVHLIGVGPHTWDTDHYEPLTSPGGSGGFVGEISLQDFKRSGIVAGFVPADGQELEAATYPDLYAWIQTGAVRTVTESDWWANPLNRGAYVIESSTGKFRVPDRNGVQSGSYVLFGRGSKSDTDVGGVKQDQLQNITGEAGGSIIGTGSWASNSALYGKTVGTRPSFLSTNDHYSVGFDAGRSARAGTETYPSHFQGLWVIRAFGTVLNPGSVDAAQLASDLAALDAQFQTLASDIGFAIIYPNGGTAVSPALITLNSRYIETNPFPGHALICKTQIKLADGSWLAVDNFIYNSTAIVGIGVRADEFQGSVVVQVGDSAITAASRLCGNPGSITSNITSAACRVLVWKIKGTFA